MNEPRFSVIILCYRHFEYLPTAIDSVLAQDYPNIELIISDDGSPNFPKEELDDYISARKGPNITNVILHQEEANCGTVRHLNHAVPLCTGDYIALLAGDDVLYDAHVLTSYAGASPTRRRTAGSKWPRRPCTMKTWMCGRASI